MVRVATDEDLSDLIERVETLKRRIESPIPIIDPSVKLFTTTTDGVIKSMIFIEVPVDELVRCHFVVKGKDATDSYTEFKMCSFRRVGSGNAVQIDAGFGDTARSAGATTWGSSGDASGIGFNLNITGQAGKLIIWTLLGAIQ